MILVTEKATQTLGGFLYLWLGDRDSNPNCVIQSHIVSYSILDLQLKCSTPFNFSVKNLHDQITNLKRDRLLALSLISRSLFFFE
jgi:hypothetical protein